MRPALYVLYCIVEELIATHTRACLLCVYCGAQDGSPMVLFVMSKREEPNLVVKTVAAEFQTANVRVMFISQPDQARYHTEFLFFSHLTYLQYLL